MYIWSLKESYSFMEGNRGLMFWISLPYKAFLIAYWSIKDKIPQRLEWAEVLHNKEIMLQIAIDATNDQRTKMGLPPL